MSGFISYKGNLSKALSVIYKWRQQQVATKHNLALLCSALLCFAFEGRWQECAAPLQQLRDGRSLWKWTPWCSLACLAGSRLPFLAALPAHFSCHAKPSQKEKSWPLEIIMQTCIGRSRPRLLPSKQQPAFLQDADAVTHLSICCCRLTASFSLWA